MIEHIVLMKRKSNAIEADMQRVLDRLRALKEQIPGILYLSAGANFSERSAGFTHALYVRLADRDAFDYYSSYPALKAVVSELDQLTEPRTVVDYET